jgi:hypothetical protein
MHYEDLLEIHPKLTNESPHPKANRRNAPRSTGAKSTTSQDARKRALTNHGEVNRPKTPIRHLLNTEKNSHQAMESPTPIKQTSCPVQKKTFLTERSHFEPKLDNF